MHNEQRDKFENWLRTACFQQPTPEAYDLAWQAWQAAQQSVEPPAPRIKAGDDFSYMLSQQVKK